MFGSRLSGSCGGAQWRKYICETVRQRCPGRGKALTSLIQLSLKSDISSCVQRLVREVFHGELLNIVVQLIDNHWGAGREA